MLKREGVDYEAMPRVAHEGNPRDLLAGRADAWVAYRPTSRSSSNNWALAYRTFSPAASASIFTATTWCTSEAELKAIRTGQRRSVGHREGWVYALEHKEGTRRSDPQKLFQRKRARGLAV